MIKIKSISKFFSLIILIGSFNGCKEETAKAYNGWEVYAGSKEGIRYSSLREIDTGNVQQLEVAWVFNTGGADTAQFSQMQFNPIIIDSMLFAVSPALRLFALNAATGKPIWEFNPDSSSQNSSFIHFILNNCRGITYWSDGNQDKRLFFVAGSYLHCINMDNGKLITGFGDSGKIDLHKGLGKDAANLFITATSPGIIYKDLFILGSREDEGPAAAPGHIRAFDVRTGELKWRFNTIPYPGEYGFDTWEDSIAYKNIGGANSWSGFTLDEEKGILYAPTGSASFDFYGGKRKGQNLFANCLLALDAATGKRIWHFQFVHHDLWDTDIPAPPALVTIEKDGKRIKAVAQTTKNAMVWVFDRETGEPVYPYEEIKVDTQSELTGEKIWSSQPVTNYIKPFARQSFSVEDINPFLPDTTIRRLQNELSGYRYGKMFIPPGKQTSVVFPGFDGGAEWGGTAFDPGSGILYVNANEMGWLLTMRDVQPETPKKENYGQAGKRLYEQYCSSCHGADRKGTGNNPALINMQGKYNTNEAMSLLNSGRRMMPSFLHLDEENKKAILAYTLELKKEQQKKFIAPVGKPDSFLQLPYRMTGYYRFISSEGYPAIKPPWGTLTAINLSTGEHVWKTTLGDYPELKAKGIPATGTENYGGPVVTAGGLVFIAASRDGKIRAFDKRNGKLLWEYELPAPGFATPSVYSVNGKQYIVIACGGGKLRTRSGDSYVAFALPGKK